MLTLGASHLLHPKINSIQAVVVVVNAEGGIPNRFSFQLFSRMAGGVKKVGFRPIDLKNFLSTVRHLMLEDGQRSCLLEYFGLESLNKSNYFYSVQFDSEEQVASIFWSDGIMRSDYACFGVVLSFDTTFRTNNLYRPLGAFIGFNHHLQICIFGAALLFNETSDTFRWLFSIFFECMKEKYPCSFLIDQCQAIQAVVLSVMPSSVFHGCVHKNCGNNLTYFQKCRKPQSLLVFRKTILSNRNVGSAKR
ncbi:hypothetical protein LIER_23615 [Lithospermum erythrorhizon]|uniref:MULE transposase domain-containing protein n=1 Tax=Lithospermum erythrorhizon TaxID=34254 RepID=A0AAV3R248_LITER